ncbi:hypothetical protein CYMTET_22528, partial [Cymbomonas tetramitiformis]
MPGSNMAVVVAVTVATATLIDPPADVMAEPSCSAQVESIDGGQMTSLTVRDVLRSGVLLTIIGSILGVGTYLAACAMLQQLRERQALLTDLVAPRGTERFSFHKASVEVGTASKKRKTLTKLTFREVWTWGLFEEEKIVGITTVTKQYKQDIQRRLAHKVGAIQRELGGREAGSAAIGRDSFLPAATAGDEPGAPASGRAACHELMAEASAENAEPPPNFLPLPLLFRSTWAEGPMLETELCGEQGPPSMDILPEWYSSTPPPEEAPASLTEVSQRREDIASPVPIRQSMRDDGPSADKGGESSASPGASLVTTSNTGLAAVESGVHIRHTGGSDWIRPGPPQIGAPQAPARRGRLTRKAVQKAEDARCVTVREDARRVSAREDARGAGSHAGCDLPDRSDAQPVCEAVASEVGAAGAGAGGRGDRLQQRVASLLGAFRGRSISCASEQAAGSGAVLEANFASRRKKHRGGSLKRQHAEVAQRGAEAPESRGPAERYAQVPEDDKVLGRLLAAQLRRSSWARRSIETIPSVAPTLDDDMGVAKPRTTAPPATAHHEHCTDNGAASSTASVDSDVRLDARSSCASATARAPTRGVSSEAGHPATSGAKQHAESLHPLARQSPAHSFSPRDLPPLTRQTAPTSALPQNASSDCSSYHLACAGTSLLANEVPEMATASLDPARMMRESAAGPARDGRAAYTAETPREPFSDSEIVELYGPGAETERGLGPQAHEEDAGHFLSMSKRLNVYLGYMGGSWAWWTPAPPAYAAPLSPPAEPTKVATAAPHVQGSCSTSSLAHTLLVHTPLAHTALAHRVQVGAIDARDQSDNGAWRAEVSSSAVVLDMGGGGATSRGGGSCNGEETGTSEAGKADHVLSLLAYAAKDQNLPLEMNPPLEDSSEYPGASLHDVCDTDDAEDQKLRAQSEKLRRGS